METALNESHLQLEAHIQELAAANEESRQFAHTVAHDLKKPLGLIAGYLELFLDDYNTPDVHEGHKYVETALQSAYKMSNIIGEILLLAETRKSEKPSTSPVDMAQVIFETRQRLEYVLNTSSAELSSPINGRSQSVTHRGSKKSRQITSVMRSSMAAIRSDRTGG